MKLHFIMIKADYLPEETQTDATTSQQEQHKSERGSKTAENMRYGESISEHGFGGETTGSSGNANQGPSRPVDG